MPVDFSLVRAGDVLQVQPADKEIKLFLERQGYLVGMAVQVVEVSEPIPSFNPRTGTDDVYLNVVVTNGKRPLEFGVRQSEGYRSNYF